MKFYNENFIKKSLFKKNPNNIKKKKSPNKNNYTRFMRAKDIYKKLDKLDDRAYQDHMRMHNQAHQNFMMQHNQAHQDSIMLHDQGYQDHMMNMDTFGMFEESIYSEGYYDAINDMEITDVFQNFENKYGKDDTTELTTFKDMKQKDAFPPHGKDRANLFKAIHERDKNIGIENKVFSRKNYLKEGRSTDMYVNDFLEGYLDALNESCNCGSKKCPICSKKKKVMNDCGISCNEEDEIFLQGYYDAIEECGDCCGEECCDGYDYDEPIDNHYMAFEEGYTDALLELL